jgi:hypothetical protein
MQAVVQAIPFRERHCRAAGTGGGVVRPAWQLRNVLEEYSMLRASQDEEKVFAKPTLKNCVSVLCAAMTECPTG